MRFKIICHRINHLEASQSRFHVLPDAKMVCKDNIAWALLLSYSSTYPHHLFPTACQPLRARVLWPSIQAFYCLGSPSSVLPCVFTDVFHWVTLQVVDLVIILAAAFFRENFSASKITLGTLVT